MIPSGNGKEEQVAACVHFIDFTGEEYWSAVKVWGEPEYIHIGWDLRARREIAEDDILVFAKGEWSQEPRVKSYADIIERSQPPNGHLYRHVSKASSRTADASLRISRGRARRKRASPQNRGLQDYRKGDDDPPG